MVTTGNPRIKRKNDSDNKIEPAMKALKKNDIIIQFKALQQKYESLEKQNNLLLEEKKNHLEAIVLLEETVKILDNKSSRVEKTSVTVQTEIIRCEECEFPADNVNDLVYHMYEFHPLEGFHSEESFEEKFQCNYCGEKFKTKGDLMMHRKDVHTDRVNLCRYFAEGHCNFGTDTCWYSHSKTKPKITTFKCSLCEKEFKNRADFMHHKKNDHSKNIPICREALNGTCRFGKMNCWYNHENENVTENGNENVNENGNGNEEVFDKLFDMMEKFTQRIVNIENNL